MLSRSQASQVGEDFSRRLSSGSQSFWCCSKARFPAFIVVVKDRGRWLKARQPEKWKRRAKAFSSQPWRAHETDGPGGREGLDGVSNWRMRLEGVSDFNSNFKTKTLGDTNVCVLLKQGLPVTTPHSPTLPLRRRFW